MRFVVLAVLALFVAGSCGEDTDEASSADRAGAPYALQSDAAWELSEAVDPADDDPVTTERPPLDWYAEYNGVSNGAHVRLSGHNSSIEDTMDEMAEIGFSFDEIDMDGGEVAYVGESTMEESGPAVFLLVSGSRTVMALSYELDVDGLAEFGESVEPADEAKWIDAGGIIR